MLLTHPQTHSCPECQTSCLTDDGCQFCEDQLDSHFTDYQQTVGHPSSVVSSGSSSAPAVASPVAVNSVPAVASPVAVNSVPAEPEYTQDRGQERGSFNSNLLDVLNDILPGKILSLLSMIPTGLAPLATPVLSVLGGVLGSSVYNDYINPCVISSRGVLGSSIYNDYIKPCVISSRGRSLDPVTTSTLVLAVLWISTDPSATPACTSCVNGSWGLHGACFGPWLGSSK